MNKPSDFENVKAFSDFEQLAPGGYVCAIKQVAEKKSKNGKDMLVVLVDIVEGPEAARFSKQFNDDTREDKKWPFTATKYILLYDNDGNTNRAFKSFIDAVTESNQGWSVVWGNGFCKCFVNKHIGCVFGNEEYLNNQGEYKMSCKLINFKNVESIKTGRYKTPEDKLLDRGNVANQYGGSFAANKDGFMDIPDGLDAELPFA